VKLPTPNRPAADQAIVDNRISAYGRYYDEVVYIRQRDAISLRNPDHPHLHRRLVVVDFLHSDPSPETFLRKLQKAIGEDDIVVVVIKNSYSQWLHSLLHSFLGTSRRIQTHNSFLTRRSLRLLASISGLELLDITPVHRFSWMRWVPLLRWSSNSSFAFFKRLATQKWKPSVSIVVPVRNERGNLEKTFSSIALLDFPQMEVVFVEGGSSDGTWEELQRLSGANWPFRVKLLQQPSSGKADAVRVGFSESQNDVLMILDGDLSVQASELVRFYEVFAEGKAELLIGTRFMFPYQPGAMRPLNFLGNLFFANLVNFFLGLDLSDLLCGTKAVARSDFRRIEKWKQKHQFIDPFGDFELIFASKAMGLVIREIPVHYRARTYGQTNIRRFRDGLRLLRMTLRAAFVNG
jgi:hypothetical protein